MKKANQTFDLTSGVGLKEALQQIDMQGVANLLLVLNPTLLLGKLLLEKGSELIGELVSTQPTTEAQRRAAIEIIKAAKDAGCSEIEITLDQKAGIDFSSTVEGIPITCAAGKFGKMTLKARYK